jgi:pyocin large subunit-like protein
MNDIEMLEGVLQCQALLASSSKPTDKETETQRYLRWAAEKIAKRIWWDNREPK